ncbi:MAG: phosphotransferase, partial [Candidatus Pacebacteria bacterium]|nr:phosphotransferase [Candidatus Paceibacterota bacterium]
TGFVLDKIIYKGDYYRKENLRHVLFSGSYKNRPCILKIYNDKRLTDEPLSLKYFNEKNKSKIFNAPKLYKYEIVSGRTGWFIAEKLPGKGSFFTQPMEDKKRKEFLKIYLEYRKNFSQKPHRKLILPENLRSDEFYIFRVHRWLELAVVADQQEYLENRRTILKSREFIPIYRNSIEIIRKEFKDRKMAWCHGHFKPHEIYKASDDEYYIIDFAHTKMYPEGYELGFIIWADWIIGADWKLGYENCKIGIIKWINEMKAINKKLKLKKFDSLIRASLIERCLGTILADVTASDRPFTEKKTRVKLLYKLINELIDNKF